MESTNSIQNYLIEKHSEIDKIDSIQQINSIYSRIDNYISFSNKLRFILYDKLKEFFLTFLNPEKNILTKFQKFICFYQGLRNEYKNKINNINEFLKENNNLDDYLSNKIKYECEQFNYVDNQITPILLKNYDIIIELIQIINKNIKSNELKNILSLENNFFNIEEILNKINEKETEKENVSENETVTENENEYINENKKEKENENFENEKEYQIELKNECQNEFENENEYENKIENEYQDEYENDLQNKYQDEYENEYLNEIANELQNHYRNEFAIDLQNESQNEFTNDIQNENQNNFETTNIIILGKKRKGKKKKDNKIIRKTLTTKKKEIDLLKKLKKKYPRSDYIKKLSKNIINQLKNKILYECCINYTESRIKKSIIKCIGNKNLYKFLKLDFSINYPTKKNDIIDNFKSLFTDGYFYLKKNKNKFELSGKINKLSILFSNYCENYSLMDDLGIKIIRIYIYQFYEELAHEYQSSDITTDNLIIEMNDKEITTLNYNYNMLSLVKEYFNLNTK